MEKLPGVRRTLAFYRLNLRIEAYREWVWTIQGFDDRQLLAASEIAPPNRGPIVSIPLANDAIKSFPALAVIIAL